MKTQRDNMMLIGAFALATALHAVTLPWVGAAVGRGDVGPAGDLEMTELASPAIFRAGDHRQVQVTVQYNHPDSARSHTAYRLDLFSLSRDRLDDNSDVVVGDSKRSINFKAADTEDYQMTIDIPMDADGPYWLIGIADYENRIPDADRSNNTRAVPLFVDGLQTPELAIESFNTPERAILGGSILVDFTVKNIGEGWAANPDVFHSTQSRPHWTDRVYLSLDDRLDATDFELRAIERTTPLKPGDDYRHEQLEVAIPRGVTGKLYLIIVADADQVLDQPGFTAGLSVREIELIDAGGPDLIVAAIARPDRLVIHRPASIAFSIANLGSNVTPDNAWVDGLYLSRDESLDDQDMPITQSPATRVLVSRDRYDSLVEVKLSESIEPGPWYLIVKADVQDAVVEPAFEGNNTLAVPVMVLTEAQADAEIQLGAPDRPDRMVVQWIEHDRLEEHRAALSRTTQPALQDKADPTPDAPLVFFPKPPAVAQNNTKPAGEPATPQRPVDPTTNQDTRPNPTLTDATQTDVAPRPQQPGSPTSPRSDGLPGSQGDLSPKRPGIEQQKPPTDPRLDDPTPGETDTPSTLPGDRRVDSPAAPNAPDTDRTPDSKTPSEIETDTDAKNPNKTTTTTPTDQPKPVETDTPGKSPDPNKPVKTEGTGDSDQKTTDTSTTQKPADDKQPKPDGQQGEPTQPSKEQTPTRAPRDDSEAPPVSIEKIEVALQEGKVLVGEGIKVTTKLPTPPGTGARTLSLPRNARVRVTFTADGKVYEAKVIKSTTYAEWDAAIEASLYRWTAQGEAVKNARPYIAIEWNYLLNDLFDDE